MPSRIRYLVASAFVLLFWLIPSADTPTGRAYLAVLQVRAWLLQADGPLTGFVRDGRLPPLDVELRLSPADPQLAARYAADCRRAAVEWAAGRSVEAKTPAEACVVDDALDALPLLVYVTPLGVRAQLPPPTASGSTALISREWQHPGRGSLLPAFLAIVLAILWRRVVPALLLGSLAGAVVMVLQQGAGWTAAPVAGAVHLLRDTLFTQVLGGLQVWDTDAGFQLRIIAFVVFLFMAIGVMSKSGGIQGMVNWIGYFARGPVSTQLCTWITGLLIFFDDYSNCIIAGTTMQPLGDRNRVSREKISYIVDSTAAPIAGLSIFSTWIAYEVSQYRAPLTMVTKDDGTPYLANDAFGVFVQTIPYRFYCIFTLLLVFLCIVLRRDFGPMLRAERRARIEGKPIADDARPMVGKDIAELEAAPGTPLRAVNGLLPVLLLVTLTVALIFYYGAFDDGGQWQVPAALTGTMDKVRWILGNSASERALMWAALAALGAAALLSLSQRILTLRQVVGSAMRSAKSLGIALLILILAWCIAQTCKDLGTSFYLTAAFRDLMSASVLPILMFLLSGLIAFATGTSYGTMAILLPNVVVLSHSIGAESAIGGTGLMVLTIGAVLEGSIFGDHCSPISDTTVLSSLGSRCDHLAHVQTQMPYALLAMATATTCGYLPMVLLGVGWWPLALLLGIGALATFLLLFGRDPARAGA